MLLTWLWTVNVLMPSDSAMLRGRLAGREGLKHLRLSRRQASKPVLTQAPPELSQEGRQVARGHDDLAGGRSPDDIQYLVHRSRFRHVAAGTGRQRLRDRVGTFDAGEQHHLRVRRGVQDPASGLDPVDPRHVEIHQHDVRLLPEERHRLIGIARRTHQPDVGLAPKEQLERFREDLVVVDHEDTGDLRGLVHVPRAIHRPQGAAV